MNLIYRLICIGLVQISISNGGDNEALSSLQRLEALQRNEIALTFEFESNNLYGVRALEMLRLSECEVSKKAAKISDLNSELDYQQSLLASNLQFSHEIKCDHSQELIDRLIKNARYFRAYDDFIKELGKVERQIADKGVLDSFANTIYVLRRKAQNYTFADEREEELRRLFDK